MVKQKIIKNGSFQRDFGPSKKCQHLTKIVFLNPVLQRIYLVYHFAPRGTYSPHLSSVERPRPPFIKQAVLKAPKKKRYEEVIITEDYYTSTNHITYSKNRQNNNHKKQDNTNGPITHPTKYKDNKQQ